MHIRSSAHRRHFISLDDSVSGLAPVVVRDMAPTPEDRMQSREMCKTLDERTARLPQPLRETFTLCAISGLSIAETAKALGLTVPATKTRFFRARSFTRSALNNVRDNPNAAMGRRMVACSPAVLRKGS
jgi:RNA polymerase sigma-70 factor (ECF subfamily)